VLLFKSLSVDAPSLCPAAQLPTSQLPASPGCTPTHPALSTVEKIEDGLGLEDSRCNLCLFCTARTAGHCSRRVSAARGYSALHVNQSA